MQRIILPVFALLIAGVALASRKVRSHGGDMSHRALQRRAVDVLFWDQPAVDYDLLYQAARAARAKSIKNRAPGNAAQ
jgi:hypothetical protein